MDFESCEDLNELCMRMRRFKCSKSENTRKESSRTRGILKKSRSADAASIINIKMKMSEEIRGSRDDITVCDDHSSNATSKNVTFADDCNCDLVEIRQFVPSSENIHLWSNRGYFQDKKINANCCSSESETRHPELAICFKDPCLDEDFLKRFQERHVALEKCGARIRTITGIILVRNVEYNKSVFVRCTVDKWETYLDINAVYIPNSSEQETDRFAFSLQLPKCSFELEFAVCYKLSNREYWDNNESRNYKIQDILHVGLDDGKQK